MKTAIIINKRGLVDHVYRDSTHDAIRLLSELRRGSEAHAALVWQVADIVRSTQTTEVTPAEARIVSVAVIDALPDSLPDDLAEDLADSVIILHAADAVVDELVRLGLASSEPRLSPIFEQPKN